MESKPEIDKNLMRKIKFHLNYNDEDGEFAK